MTDDREVFKVRRDAGLKARHEQRLENATYTAAEVKVLTEAALRLGRREAGDEIAKEILAAATRYVHATQRDIVYDMERLARHVASQPAPDATSGRTDPGDLNG